MAAGIDRTEGDQRGREEDDASPRKALGEKAAAQAKDKGDEIGEPDGDGNENLERRGTGGFAWMTYESQSNFIFTEPRNARGESGPAVARSAYEHLYARKVLVRYFPSHALTASFLRISVGTEAEMAILSETLDAWHKE